MRALLLASVCFTSLLGALLGYDIGIVSGAIVFITKDMSLSTWQAEVVVGSLNLVSAFGALLAGSFADRFGRKAAICLANALFVFGTLTVVLSYGFSGLLAGRILMGFGAAYPRPRSPQHWPPPHPHPHLLRPRTHDACACSVIPPSQPPKCSSTHPTQCIILLFPGVGCGFVVGPLYTAELSPPERRGMFTSLFEVSIGTGILVGYLVAYVCRDMPLHIGWRVMVGCGGVPPLVSLLLLAGLPESPRFLWAAGRRQQARGVLQRVMDPAEVEACCEEIDASVVGAAAPRDALRALLSPRSRGVRLMVVVGLGLTVSQQANGSEAVVYYMPAILQGAGVRGRDGLLGFTVLVGVFRTLCILAGALLVDRVGRRPLLLASTAGVAASLALLAAGLWRSTLWLTLLGLCGFMGAYAIGIGPLNMVVISEIFPFRLRAVAMSLALFLNRLVSGAVASSFLSLTEMLSAEGTFLLFAIIASLSWLFVLRRVPETRGRSLEEMEAYFEQLADEQSQLTPLLNERGAGNTNSRGSAR
jgi:MFS family permease